MSTFARPSGLRAVSALLASAAAALVLLASPVAHAAPARTAFEAGLKYQPSARADAATSSTWGVLYKQFDKANGDGIFSQDAESEFDSYDSQGADDFVVPGGNEWEVQEVTAKGFFTLPDVATIAGVRVVFYANNNNTPGAVVASHLVGPAGVSVSNDKLVVDTPPVILSGGTIGNPKATTYWVSVQVVMDFEASGQWFWATRKGSNKREAMWRNPGGGFDGSCTSYSKLSNCLNGGPKQDFLFELRGYGSYSTPPTGP